MNTSVHQSFYIWWTALLLAWSQDWIIRSILLLLQPPTHPLVCVPQWILITLLLLSGFLAVLSLGKSHSAIEKKIMRENKNTDLQFVLDDNIAADKWKKWNCQLFASHLNLWLDFLYMSENFPTLTEKRANLKHLLFENQEKQKQESKLDFVCKS